MSIDTKDALFLSADRLFLYEMSSHSWRLYTVSKSTLTFPYVLGVNDGIEHGGMQCSDCVSMSGLHNGQDLCHIGKEILTLAHCFRIFPYHLAISTPKIGGRWLNFRMGFFSLMSG
jgi:hypothetical protein